MTYLSSRGVIQQKKMTAKVIGTPRLAIAADKEASEQENAKLFLIYVVVPEGTGKEDVVNVALPWDNSKEALKRIRVGDMITGGIMPYRKFSTENMPGSTREMQVLCPVRVNGLES